MIQANHRGLAFAALLFAVGFALILLPEGSVLAREAGIFLGAAALGEAQLKSNFTLISQRQSNVLRVIWLFGFFLIGVAVDLAHFAWRTPRDPADLAIWAAMAGFIAFPQPKRKPMTAGTMVFWVVIVLSGVVMWLVVRAGA